MINAKAYVRTSRKIRVSRFAKAAASLICACIILENFFRVDIIQNSIFYVKYGAAYAYDMVCGGSQFKAILSFDSEKANDIYLAELDEDFLDYFYESGGTITILSREDYKNELHRDSEACYYYEQKKIYVSTINGNPAVIHEMGHFIDSQSNYDDTQEFLDIVRNEGSQLYKVKGYAATSTDEYFAVAFQYYILWPNALKVVAPETYIYMDRIYNEITGSL